MSSIKIFISKHWFFVLSLIYLLTRVVNLLSLPIFNDEAIYLDWANKIKLGYVSLFYPLYDGKPPLHFLLISVFLKIFKDPLLAGRLSSVLAGFFALVAIKKIAHILNQKIEVLTVFLYIISPIFIFYDRQALQESLLTTLLLWSFYFFIMYFKSFKLINILISSVIFALAFWTKTSALLMLLPAFIFLGYQFIKNKDRQNSIIISAFVFIIIFVIFLIPLLMQKNSGLMFSRNDRYLLGASVSIKILFQTVVINLIKTFHIYFWFLNVYILFISYALWSAISKRELESIGIYLIFLIPLVFIIFLSKSVNDRYLEPFSIFLIFIAALGFYSFKEKIKKLAYLLFIFPFVLSVFQIFSIDKYLATLNSRDSKLGLGVYLGGFTSGYGVNSAIDYLKDLSYQYKKMYIGVRIDAGNPESALMAYFLEKENSKIVPLYFDSRAVKLPLADSFIGYKYPMYFVSRDNNLAGMDEYLTEVKRFYKPDNSYVGIYQFNKMKK